MHVAIGVLIGRILGNWILLGLLLVALLIGVDARLLGGAITNTAKGVPSAVGQLISERGAASAAKTPVPTPAGGFRASAADTPTPTPTVRPPKPTPPPPPPPEPPTKTATATAAPATATATVTPAPPTSTVTATPAPPTPDVNATRAVELRKDVDALGKKVDAAIDEFRRLAGLFLTPVATATPTVIPPATPPTPAAGTPTPTPVRAAAPGTTPLASPTVVAPPAPATTPSTACPAGWPATAEEFFRLVTEGQPVSDGSWIPLSLAEVHRAPNEPCSWVAKREKNLKGEIVPFWMTTKSFTACVIYDGWMASPAERAEKGRKAPDTALGSGVRSNWSGLVEGVKITPYCPAGLQ